MDKQDPLSDEYWRNLRDEVVRKDFNKMVEERLKKEGPASSVFWFGTGAASTEKPTPVDSGFDDPDHFRNPEHRQTALHQLRQEQDDEEQSLKPWPLAFAIFGLGIIFAIGFALLFSGCSAHTLLFYPNGKPKMVTNADADSFRLGADGSLLVTGMKHSTEQDAISRTITARANGAGGILGAAGTAALFH